MLGLDADGDVVGVSAYPVRGNSMLHTTGGDTYASTH